jgi:hypothetical protein
VWSGNVVLRETAGLPDCPEASQLREQLRHACEKLKWFFLNTKLCTRGLDIPKDQVFARALAHDGPDYPVDAVLRFSLAHNAGLTAVWEMWAEAAADLYRRQADGYDQILGELIPPDFRTAVREPLEEDAYAAGSNKTALDDWGVFKRLLHERRQQPGRALSTGLAEFDSALGGGLHALTCLAGDTGHGKTTPALLPALGVLRRQGDAAVLFYSLEMPKTRIYERIVCHESGLDYATLCPQTPAAAALPSLQESLRRLEQTVLRRLKVVDATALRRLGEPLTDTLILQHRQELLQETGASRVLVVLDYLQIVDVPKDSGAGLEADQYLLRLLRSAHAATVTVKQPDGDAFLVLSRVRKRQGAGPLTLDDLLGSGGIKHDPGTVLFLEPTDGGTGPDALNRGGEWSDLDRLRALSLTAPGRRTLGRLNLRVYACADYFQRWDAFFCWQPPGEAVASCAGRDRPGRPDGHQGNLAALSGRRHRSGPLLPRQALQRQEALAAGVVGAGVRLGGGRAGTRPRGGNNDRRGGRRRPGRLNHPERRPELS